MKLTRNGKWGLGIAAIVVLAAAVPVLAQGWGPGPGHGDHHGRMMDRMMDRLQLTEEQRTQVEALMQERHEAMEGNLDRLREAHGALAEAIHAPAFDEAAIRDAAAAVAAIEADLAVERARGYQDFRKILTPDQQTKLDEMHEMMGELGMGGGYGPGPHGAKHP